MWYIYHIGLAKLAPDTGVNQVVFEPSSHFRSLMQYIYRIRYMENGVDFWEFPRVQIAKTALGIPFKSPSIVVYHNGLLKERRRWQDLD